MNKFFSKRKVINYLVSVLILFSTIIFAKTYLTTTSKDVIEIKRICDSFLVLGYERTETDLIGALTYFKSAKKYADSVNYKQGIAISASYIGYVYERLGDFDSAYHYLRISEDAFLDKQPLGNKTDSNGLSLVYTHYSILFKDAKNKNAAIDYAKKALSIDRKFETTNSALKNEKLISDYFNLGELYRLYSKFDSARNELNSAKALIKPENGDTTYFNSIYKINFAQIIMDEERCNSSKINHDLVCAKRDSAKAFFEEVITKSESGFEDKGALSEAYLGLSNCYLGMEKYDTALFYALHAKELSKSVKCEDCEYKVNLALSKIYTAKNDIISLNNVSNLIVSHLDTFVKRISSLNISLEKLNEENKKHYKEHQVKTDIFFYALILSVVLAVLFILINSISPKPTKGSKLMEILVLSPIWLSLLFLYEYIILLSETTILHHEESDFNKFNLQILIGLILVICHSQATEGVQHYIKKKYGGSHEVSTDHAIKSFLKFTIIMLVILFLIYFLSPYFHH